MSLVGEASSGDTHWAPIWFNDNLRFFSNLAYRQALFKHRPDLLNKVGAYHSQLERLLNPIKESSESL